MNRANTPVAAAPAKTVRCAIYTRKSTEEGLQQEFNSLDAQREAAAAYIASQRHEGWVGVASRYDDGGFTGGNMERPALKRLLADTALGAIDAVIVYKVDRLSRSLLDFAKMMEVFDQHQVSFASVTQQFNTATSMGRLVLHVLLSFAQFEREIISERTRDKIAATRRKGKWSGGHSLLGYDVINTKLVVNAAEAERVLQIFRWYLEQRALLPVVQELARRGWLTKRWATRKGPARGGRAFTKNSLHALLTNVTYCGKVRYKQEVHDGEQTALVDESVWQEVQALLRAHGRAANGGPRSRSGALLAGLLRCRPCGCAMTPAHATRNKNLRYRYYVCTAAQKRGWGLCPSKSVPAAQIEQFVVGQVRELVLNPAACRAAVAAWDERAAVRLRGLLLGRPDPLGPRDQARLVRALVGQVDYDGARGTVAITYQPAGFESLAASFLKSDREDGKS